MGKGEPVSDEEFAERLRLTREVMNLDERFPQWFWEAKHFAYFSEEALELELGKKFTPEVCGAFDVLRWDIQSIQEAIEEGAEGPAAMTALRFYYFYAEAQLRKSFSAQYAAVYTWRKKASEGMQRGYAADKNSWHRLFDENEAAWMKRRPNNDKLWVWSAAKILKAIARDVNYPGPLPDVSTITKHRLVREKRLAKNNKK